MTREDREFLHALVERHIIATPAAPLVAKLGIKLETAKGEVMSGNDRSRVAAVISFVRDVVQETTAF